MLLICCSDCAAHAWMISNRIPNILLLWVMALIFANGRWWIPGASKAFCKLHHYGMKLVFRKEINFLFSARFHKICVVFLQKLFNPLQLNKAFNYALFHNVYPFNCLFIEISQHTIFWHLDIWKVVYWRLKQASKWGIRRIYTTLNRNYQYYQTGWSEYFRNCWSNVIFKLTIYRESSKKKK